MHDYVIVGIQTLLFTFSIWLLICNNLTINLMKDLYTFVEKEKKLWLIQAFNEVCYRKVLFRMIMLRDWRSLYDPMFIERYKSFLEK